MRESAHPKAARLFALTGGFIQVCVAFAFLFLPVFATCMNGECSRASYVAQGGTVIGYSLLGGMIALGAAVVATQAGLLPNLSEWHIYRVLWLAVVGSFIALVVGAWSIGFAFAPGGAFMLVSALSSRKQIEQRQ